ncbi:MAG TPA: aminotransferase class V-fold PLP-dependent enzyme [Thermoanaerobaculia bacterium]|jgi:selenocysteine lyase/cysteine desulfurase|nr:aminotransferase class V-fold PLP-dependent enzyme [Thermoanaerobaculia bacterium]
MRLDRRSLLSGAAASLVLPGFRVDAGRRLLAAAAGAAGRPASDLAADEAYWSEIQRAFDTDRTLVNLNNGGCSPTPSHVLEAMIRDLRFTNEMPVHHLWDILEPRVESVRRDLAAAFGCDAEEMAITRNASEAMETLILGIDLQPGDEVVVTNQNYGRMLTTWEQRTRRHGVVVRQISFPVPPPSAADVVERFRQALTPRTRVIEVPHITNLSGQILPVRDIVRLGREHGVEVFVDGAHAFAHFPFRRDDLDCDYYGTSLHKWLLAPIGTGFLYVRKEKQKRIWPLMAAPQAMDENVRKYEEIGTHPAANHNAIAGALAFHAGIGGERKAARLRLLRDRWAKRLLAVDSRIRVLTPLNDVDSCAIGLVHVEGIDTRALQTHLWERHRIMTTPIVHAEFNGLRVTPNVYTTLAEVDLFAETMEGIVRKGLPA